MNDLIDRIKVVFQEWAVDAEENASKGNKAAGVRARKKSLELETMLKEYRKKSLAK